MDRKGSGNKDSILLAQDLCYFQLILYYEGSLRSEWREPPPWSTHSTVSKYPEVKKILSMVSLHIIMLKTTFNSGCLPWRSTQDSRQGKERESHFSPTKYEWKEGNCDLVFGAAQFYWFIVGTGRSYVTHRKYKNCFT